MDPPGEHREAAAGAVGRARIQVAGRAQQQSQGQEVSRSRTPLNGKTIAQSAPSLTSLILGFDT